MAVKIFKRLRELLDVDTTGVSDGDALTYDAGTDTWVPGSGGGGGGAPTDADYLVGTSNGDLDSEIVVGTSPGGELGGTWASPTVDATHSGSSHASVQAAAEATAAGALASHASDTTGVHGITDTSALALTANVQPLDSDLTAIAALTTTTFGRALLELANQAALLSAAGAAAASHVHAGEDITSGTVADARIASTIARDSEVTSAISALSSVYQPLDSDLTAIAALTTTTFGRSLLTQADAAATRATLDLEAGTDFPSLSTFNDHSARHEDGGGDEISLAGLSGEPADTVNKSLFDANTVLAANSDNTPAAVTMGASTILARLAAGNIKAASPSELRTLLDVPTNAEAILDTIIDAKGDVLVGSAADTVARLAVGSDGQVLTADAASTNGIKWAAASGSTDDPIATLFGTPDVAYEFDSSSLTGLTAVGSSPDVEAAHTTIPSHYYVERRTNSGGLMGRYAAVTAPFTAIIKVTDANFYSEFNKVAMFIGASGVVNNDVFNVAANNRALAVHRWNASSGFSSDVYSGGSSPNIDVRYVTTPFYMAIKAASNSDVDYLFSWNGRVWMPFLRTRNPSITIALVGMGVACETSGIEVGAAFDFLRIWNSAKTFLGAQ